jgi:adenosyl cobinamide kinase/adenosyl cobinamide phosphate guanylyltransferase
MTKTKRTVYVVQSKMTDKEMTEFLKRIEEDIQNYWDLAKLYPRLDDTTKSVNKDSRYFEIVAREVPRPK